MKRVLKGGRWDVVPVVTAAGIAAIAFGLLMYPGQVGEGVRGGLRVCANILIPSLFPFMVLAVFLSMTEYSRILSAPLSPITTRVYKLPAELGGVVLLSMIGGYPVGGKMIATLLERKKIDAATAERMLCFCVNSGPSFLISAVGAGMFRDKTAGVILFAAQTITTLLIGWIVSIKAPAARGGLPRDADRNPAAAFVLSVSAASSSMIIMCSFAVFFSGFFALLTASGAAERVAGVLPVGENVATAIISGFFEVTAGCLASAEVGGPAAFGLACACLSFSGLSVLFQIMSCFSGMPIRFRPMILSRIAHGVLSTAMAVPAYKLLCRPHSVWASAVPPQIQDDSRTTLFSVCLLAMCAIFTLSLGSLAEKRRS